MAFTSGNGGNPRFGRDSAGTLPPGGVLTQHVGPSAFPFVGNQPRYVYMTPQQATTSYGTHQLGANQSYFYGFNTGATVPASPLANMQAPIANQNSAIWQSQGPRPLQDHEFRTCNMRNSTGGFGCEPGYNYFFPAEHTKIHVLKTGATPPWQLPANFTIQFHACHVPVNTTVVELMKGFGAKNSVPKKNVITEVCPGGAGKWYKGIELRGDNFDILKKPIKDFGWDATRTGLRGQKKVVYVYVQRD